MEFKAAVRRPEFLAGPVATCIRSSCTDPLATLLSSQSLTLCSYSDEVQRDPLISSPTQKSPEITCIRPTQKFPRAYTTNDGFTTVMRSSAPAERQVLLRLFPQGAPAGRPAALLDRAFSERAGNGCAKGSESDGSPFRVGKKVGGVSRKTRTSLCFSLFF